MPDDLISLAEALHSGDLSRLSELAAALKSYPPEAVWSALQVQGLQITGDGNIVGSGNVTIVVKRESPELATRLAELAKSARAAALYGQADSALEHGRLHQAFAALAELHNVDAHYPGTNELLARARRTQAWRRLRIGILTMLGVSVLFGLLYSLLREKPPQVCDTDRGIGTEGAVLAMAFEEKQGANALWIGRSERGIEVVGGSTPVYPVFHNSSILSLAVDSQNHRAWVGMSGRGLAIGSFQGIGNTWRSLGPTDGLPGCQISTIVLGRERVYVGAYDGSGLGISSDLGAHWHLLSAPAGTGGKGFFNVRALAEDLDGSLWVGTVEGFYRLVGETWDVPSLPSWLQPQGRQPWITAIAVDRDGTKWIGTKNNNGLALLDSQSGEATWIGPVTVQDGLASDDLTAIAVLPNGSGVLVGTEKGLNVCRKKREGDEWGVICAVIDRPDLRGKWVRSLVVSPDGLKTIVGTDGSSPVSLEAAEWSVLTQ